MHLTPTPETLLDLVDLYTHHRTLTLLGQTLPLETFISIRIALNQEASAHHYPRYTMTRKDAAIRARSNGEITKTSNGTKKGPQTPTSPGDNHSGDLATSPLSVNGISKPGLKDGTVRFMLDPKRARDEKEAVGEFFRVEEEEFEVEVPREVRRP